MSDGTNWAPDLGVGGTQVPVGCTVGMAASENPKEDDYILFDASGNGVVASGNAAQAGLKAAGVMYPDKRSDVSTTAGANKIRVWNGWGMRYPEKSGDEFAATDRCVPAYLSAAKEIGKTSHTSGALRAIAGLMVRLDPKGDPIVWGGEIGQLIARISLLVDSHPFAEYDLHDAAASTTISERVIGYVTAHGVVTAASFGGAAVAADNTDYATGTIAKRVPTDSYAAATTIATFDTRSSGTGAVTAFTPYALALSGTAAALRLIPGTLITLVTAKGGSGKVLSGALTLTGKVI